MGSITRVLPRAKTKAVCLTWQKAAYTDEESGPSCICSTVPGQCACRRAVNQGIVQGKNKGCVPYLTKGCLYTWGPSYICSTVPGQCACRRAVNQGIAQGKNKGCVPYPTKGCLYTWGPPCICSKIPELYTCITKAMPRAKTKVVCLTWQKAAYTHKDHHSLVVQSQSYIHVDGQYNQDIAQGKNKGCVSYLTKGCLYTWGPSCICSTVPEQRTCTRAVWPEAELGRRYPGILTPAQRSTRLQVEKCHVICWHSRKMKEGIFMHPDQMSCLFVCLLSTSTLANVTFLKISFYRKPRRIFWTVSTSHIH